MSTQRYRLLTALCCLLLAMFSGCQFAPNFSKPRWPWAKEKPAPMPERVMAVWTDTVLHQSNQPGVRGFGGRVYFYEQEGKDPIEVDGGLAVYVFDADKLELHDQRPLRKFVFTPEQFASHMSRTSLGASYSVWLPWGEVGGPPKRLSLIARYEGKTGGTNISEPTIKMLPGVPERSVSSEAEMASQNGSSPYQLVGHTSSTSEGTVNAANGNQATENGGDFRSQFQAPSKRPRNIPSIDLPPSFQRHLQRSRSSGASWDATAKPPSSSLPAESSEQSPTVELTDQAATITVDADGLASLQQAQSSNPSTTQVSDYRTRNARRFNTSPDHSRIDIRDGKWIETLPRIGRQE